MKKVIFGLLISIVIISFLYSEEEPLLLAEQSLSPETVPTMEMPKLSIRRVTSLTLGFILVILPLLIFLEMKIGKYIGLRLSKDNGLILGIILIVWGVTLFIGIPIIIYSGKGNTKKCPFCANSIKAEAVVCQFCHKDLPAQ